MRDILGARTKASPRLLGAAFLVLLLTVAVGCSQDRAKAVSEMNKGIEAFQGGQSIEAVKYLEAAKNTDPTFAEPALYLGQLYHRELDELDNAEQAYREAQQRKPQDPDIAYKLGTVLAEKGDHSEAIALFDQAIEINPAHAKALFRKGRSQEALGNNAEAADEYMKSIRANARMKMDEEDPGGAAYHALGDLYVGYGFYDKALAVYENGVLNNEGVTRLAAGLGLAQLKLKRYQEAATTLETVLEVDPRHVSGTFNLAVARNELGQHDAAIAVLEQYLTRAEDQARRSAAQGLLQTLRTDKKQAAK
jgi:tetratricopeptide (TPR) repeat protein